MLLLFFFYYDGFNTNKIMVVVVCVVIIFTVLNHSSFHKAIFIFVIQFILIFIPDKQTAKIETIKRPTLFKWNFLISPTSWLRGNVVCLLTERFDVIPQIENYLVACVDSVGSVYLIIIFFVLYPEGGPSVVSMSRVTSSTIRHCSRGPYL